MEVPNDKPVKEAEDIAVPELCQGKRKRKKKESVGTVETITELRQKKRKRKRKRKRREESNLIPKDWPALEECPQYQRLMHAALYAYPWEEDDYVFDFDAFYPPLPDGPPWLLKLLEVTKHMVWPAHPQRIRELCPVCCPHVEDPVCIIYPEIGKHPVWDMDPIPNPFHILNHIYRRPGFPNQCPRIVTPDQLESTKKFLKQLRATRGYNVVSIPHDGLVNSCYFSDTDLGVSINGRITIRKCVENGLQGVIDHISSKTSKSYHLVEVLKVITTKHMFLVTFDAAAAASPAAVPETFIASLKSLHPSAHKPAICDPTKSNSNILECLLLPDYDAPYKTKPHPPRTRLIS